MVMFLEPKDGLMAIGSEEIMPLAAAKSSIMIQNLNAERIARQSLEIAAGLCIYTNNNITIEKIK